MKRRFYAFSLALGLVATFGLGLSGCGPLSSVVCDRAAGLCPEVDIAACDATVDLLPPRTRSESLSCVNVSRTCTEVVDCFARYQLVLPTY